MDERDEAFARVSAIMRDFLQRLSGFACDRRGALAVKLGLMLPVLMLIVGGAVDYGIATTQKSQLQAAVDLGAVAAAREMGMADQSTENVEAIVRAVVAQHLKINLDRAFGAAPLELKTEVRREPFELEVEARQKIEMPFGDVFGLSVDTLSARSIARIVSNPNICALALDPREAGTISLDYEARVTANDCAVFSNSDHAEGIRSRENAVLKASLICSRGGTNTHVHNFSPAPLTDCPSFEDPLAERPEPFVGRCEHRNLVIAARDAVLGPGTYCGGIKIHAGARVRLEPGVYVMKDGPIWVAEGGALTGDGVGFFLKGRGATLKFGPQTTIALTAPKDGPLAGLLIFESRRQPMKGLHEIRSDDARVLLGTIYIPRGILHIDANAPIADQSAYTVIVARRMRLFGGPHLVLNSNYNDTEVPVPEGIKGVGQPVAVVE